MSGIQFLADEKGGKVAVEIDLRKHGALGGFLRRPGLGTAAQERGFPVGDFRVVYVIDDDRRMVSVTRIAHRWDDYES